MLHSIHSFQNRIFEVLLTLLLLQSTQIYANPPKYVEIRRDILIQTKINGKKAEPIKLLKGEMLEVLQITPSGYLVKKGDIDPIALQRYQVERPSTTATTRPVVKFKPFYEKQWQKHGVSRKLYPWVGENMVILTLSQDLDPNTIHEMLEYLDAGWAYYKSIIGKNPSLSDLSREFDGRGTIITATDPQILDGNAGLGAVGGVGIEVAYFYRGPHNSIGDYERFKKEKTLPSYYFYEMGRNYYCLGDTHNIFATGFAVVMSILCLDHIEQKATLDGRTLNNNHRRTQARLVELAFHKSQLSWNETFQELGGTPVPLKDDNGNPLPNNLSDLYSGIVLYLHETYGGDQWLKRFYSNLSQYPPSPTNSPEGTEGQLFLTLIAASAAAQENLIPLFKNRWRMPLKPEVYNALQAIDWAQPNAHNAWKSLPKELLPKTLQLAHPDLPTSLPKRNLLKNPSFEQGLHPWTSQDSRLSRRENLLTEGKDGFRSLKIFGKTPHTWVKQTLNLPKNRKYLLSGWINTKNLHPLHHTNGAKLQFNDVSSQTISKTDDEWAYVSLLIEASSTQSVTIYLVVENSLGYAIFDNITLTEMPK